MNDAKMIRILIFKFLNYEDFLSFFKGCNFLITICSFLLTVENCLVYNYV